MVVVVVGGSVVLGSMQVNVPYEFSHRFSPQIEGSSEHSSISAD